MQRMENPSPTVGPKMTVPNAAHIWSTQWQTGDPALEQGFYLEVAAALEGGSSSRHRPQKQETFTVTHTPSTKSKITV